jgi:hypothetical protein
MFEFKKIIRTIGELAEQLEQRDKRIIEKIDALHASVTKLIAPKPIAVKSKAIITFGAPKNQ